ncbi:hypothetical protein DFH07DRAFT_965980 [Mycena maculata]|uniref:Secreted protein n=1 Tax=Mycena maculata TaxID=230809 RepID=A0AAD7IAE0_9AGAR|nr:hypothetical protein DFH07DRAFT_965980 [Mycena maculata]
MLFVIFFQLCFLSSDITTFSRIRAHGIDHEPKCFAQEVWEDLTALSRHSSKEVSLFRSFLNHISRVSEDATR